MNGWTLNFAVVADSMSCKPLLVTRRLVAPTSNVALRRAKQHIAEKARQNDVLGIEHIAIIPDDSTERPIIIAGYDSREQAVGFLKRFYQFARPAQAAA